MSNYRGQFKAYDGDLYEVQLIGDPTSNTYTEIALAGDNPFTVTYNTSSTPFDPIRTSTATIQIVHNDYLEDIYTPYAHAVQVKLKNETKGTWEWVGFLTPRIYDQGYSSCLETIQLEASDCLASLQYFGYTLFEEYLCQIYECDYSPEPVYYKTFVSFHDILTMLCEKCELLSGFYWTRSKKVGNTILMPDQLMVSEQNFFSDDTDEPWKFNQVLEEMCRYLGFTAMQWKDKLYLVDYEYLSSTANTNIYASEYLKANDYAESASPKHLDNPVTVTADSYRGSGASISFEPIYNKITVQDNFYDTDEFVPDIYKDKYLSNRIVPCNFYTYFEIVNPGNPDKAEYPWKGATNYNDKNKTEDSADTEYRYFHRPFEHQYWQSLYYTTGGTYTALMDSQLADRTATRDFAGATILDHANVRDGEALSGSGTYRTQEIVPSKQNFERYLCISQKGLGKNYAQYNTRPLLKLVPGFRSLCPFTDHAYLVINYSVMFEKYVNRDYINPAWSKNTVYWKQGTKGVQKSDGNLRVRVKMGNYWWDFSGKTWSNESTSSLAYQTRSMFQVETKWLDKDKKEDRNIGTVQQTMNVLNTVTWSDGIDQEGYKIPLAGMSMLDDISIEIGFPTIQFQGTLASDDDTSWNQYAWVKDLTFKICEPGQDLEGEDNDIVYENVIDVDAINEMGTISVRFTTWTENTKPSYSNVVYYKNSQATMLGDVTEPCISNIPQKCEENIIEKYVKQYGSSTKKISATLDMDATPLTIVYGIDVDRPTQRFVPLGTEIDYKMQSQNITLIELK